MAIGRMKEFNPDDETVTAYLERFDLFAEVNNIADNKKVATLLTVIGARHYSLIQGLVSPTKPKDKTLAELQVILQQHFDPEPIVIAQRFHFYQRSQKPGESLADYLAGLRQLASRCKFGTFLSEALRDRLVCGLQSEAIQKALLSKADLTLDTAVETAQGMEAAARKAKDIQGNHKPNPVLSVKTTNRRCCHCGRSNHPEHECRFKTATCHKCGKVGHIKPICTSPKPTSNRTHYVDTGSVLEEEPIFVVRDRGKSSQPYQVELAINGQPLHMEVDTGAAVSLAPESSLTSVLPDATLRKTGVTLKTYTGEQIPVKGILTVDVTYDQQQYRNLELLVVGGSGPSLLGRDWLKVVKLDWRRIGNVSASQSPESRIASLKEKYKSVFSESLGTITPMKAKLNVRKDAQPKFFKPRPIPYALRERVNDELDRLEEEGVLEKTHYSEWAAPIVVVPKKDGRLRLCGDFKVTVNPALDVDQYPLPRPEDIFASLSGGKQFTTLDLSQAYNQMELDEDSRKYATINTPKGLYQHTRLPFGIASAPAIFQRMIDQILHGIDGTASFIDDIAITGKTLEEHFERLEEVLRRLEKHDIHVNLPKCQFLKPSVNFLGHRIDAEGIHAMDDKLEAIVKAPAPENEQQLRSFLGLINYYGKFISNLSTLVHPLNNLLCKGREWKWTKECQHSFDQAKQTLVSSKVLTHYSPDLPIRMAGDASAYGVGAVISHVLPDGTERPVAFASRTLSSSEKNYAQVEKEALSLIFGIKRFHYYLYGRPFTIVTDHKPLTAILGPKKGIPPLAAARLQRWAWILSAYQYEIEFRPTNDHCNADGLSRLPLSESAPTNAVSEVKIFNISQMEALPVNTRQLRAATASDSILSKVFRYTRNGSWPHKIPPALSSFADKRNELTVEEGCLLWGIRVIVPKTLREKLLKELHQDHPGMSRMKSVARSYMWWPGLDKELETLAKSCQACQAVKRSPTVTPLHPWIWPSRPWQRVHLDFAGPFQGCMFLVAMDAYSKWPEVRVMSSTSAAKTLDVLREWFSAHGIPEHIVTDNGPQFTAEEFEVFTKRNGIKHVKSAPYHPASNGLAERFIQSLKQSLKASQHDGRSLIQRISTYLLTYRTTAHSTTGVPPCKLFLQRELRTRLTLLQPDCERSVLDKQSQQKMTHDRSSRLRAWSVGDKVMARNLRPGPDWVPATIVDVLGPVSYMVETEEGQRWKRHSDQMKGWIAPALGNRTQVDVETGDETDTPPFPEISDPVRPPNSDVTPPNPQEPVNEDAARGTSPLEDRHAVPSVPVRQYPLRDARNPHPRYK